MSKRIIWPCFHAAAIEQGFKGHDEDCLFSHETWDGYISNNPKPKDSIMAFRNNNKPFKN